MVTRKTETSIIWLRIALNNQEILHLCFIQCVSSKDINRISCCDAGIENQYH